MRYWSFITCTEQTVARVQRECPFCSQYFQGLGNHLQHCKDRQGRDYFQYLSQKTLQKTRKRKEICPKCQKAFLRLDTHLKNSAFCRTISPPAINCETVVPDNPRPCPLSDLFHTSSYERQPDPVSQIPEQFPSQSTQILPPVAPSRTLMLTAFREDWNKADSYFRENLVPSVVEAPSEVKNDLLTRGIYDYFAEQYGIPESNNTEM